MAVADTVAAAKAVSEEATKGPVKRVASEPADLSSGLVVWQLWLKPAPATARSFEATRKLGQGWIRTSEGVKPADLQSAPFGHFGTYPSACERFI
jgi:hypothetical protein